LTRIVWFVVHNHALIRIPSNPYLKEAFYEKPLILADREMVELHSDEILLNAGTEDVSLLVVGDPFGSDKPFF
jgi:diphthamide biosynthesis methyltransferase